MHDQLELDQLNPLNRGDISRGIWFFVDPCAPQNRWDSGLRHIFGPAKIWKTSIDRSRHWNCTEIRIFCWTHRWASAYGWFDDWRTAPCPNANSWSVRANGGALDWRALRIVLAFPSNHNYMKWMLVINILRLANVKQCYLLPDLEHVSDACVRSKFALFCVLLHFSRSSETPLTSVPGVRTHFCIHNRFTIRFWIHWIANHSHVGMIKLLAGNVKWYLIALSHQIFDGIEYYTYLASASTFQAAHYAHDVLIRALE